MRAVKFTPEQKMYYTLRIAIAVCFIGHGAFGILTKQVWCNYFAIFGISPDMAYRLMPPLGMVDILIGITMLFYPLTIIPLWLIFWGAVTALLRPLSGEPFAEFFERAGNYGAPAAMILLTGIQIRNLKSLFTPVRPNFIPELSDTKNALFCLRIVVFLLLAGHGWLNIMEKKGLIDQYASLGFSNPMRVAQTAGWFEILGAFAVLIRPVKGLLIVLFVWKVGSELFYPHYGWFEWMERAGSYGSILALWFGADVLPNLLRNKPPSAKLFIKPV
ncbi:MAG: hypothetical protein ABI415_03405 [Flavitalea sp.]